MNVNNVLLPNIVKNALLDLIIAIDNNVMAYDDDLENTWRKVLDRKEYADLILKQYLEQGRK